MDFAGYGNLFALESVAEYRPPTARTAICHLGKALFEELTVQGCENHQRLNRIAVSAVTTMAIFATSLACAQEVVHSGTPIVESDTSGQVVYSTDGQHGEYIAPAGASYSPYGMNYSPSLGAHLRARYNTRSYGQVRGNLDLGTMKIFDAPNGVWFGDVQITMNDESKVGYNAGVGYRFMTLPLLPNSVDREKIAGISIWSDGSSTVNENFFPQIGVSLEYLGDFWDVRLNSYLPTKDFERGATIATDNIGFSEKFLIQETITPTDEALKVTEIELARRLGNRDAWLFGGTYGLFGDSVDTAGTKLGVRGYVTPDLLLQFAVNDDDEFGTNSVFSATWFIGRTRDPSYCSPSLRQRMREPVIRNDYVAIRQGSEMGGTPLEGDFDGEVQPIQVVHVDSTAAAGGDGSFENPLNMLSGIEANSDPNAIVLVHGGSSFTDDPAVLQDGQRMLGEGGGIEHMVTTTNFGVVTLPETAVGAMDGPIPTIDNTGAAVDAVTLAVGTTEVSNLSITGGDRGVVSPNGSLGVNINNLTVADTTGNGIELTPGTETIDGDLMVRFQPMLTNLTFTNIGGDDIFIDAASPEPASVPVTENIVISEVTSTFGDGVGINLSNNQSAVSITDYSHDLGDGAAGGGILLTNTEGVVTLTDATIGNEAGFGISVVDSTADHVFNQVEITDTTGTAMHVSGGTGDVMFTGKITQGAAGATVLVENGHSGALDFFEGTADDGVIDAQFGDGLVFNNADGTYTFLDGVSITGTDMGIDITNGSDGTVSLLEATITDTNGVAVHVEGGEASLNYTGKITQNNAFDTVFVENGHTGTLAFNELDSDEGLIDAFNGDGLQFDDADGTYRFTGQVVLDGTSNGADTAIDLLNDTDGTFEFNDATITDPTGIAVNVDGGSSIFTLTGQVSQNNNAAAVSVSGGHDGDMTFLSPDATTNVVTATNGTGLQFNDADGNYAFTGSVELDGSSVAADTGIDIINDSAGTFTFSDTTITDPTGTAFNVVGGSADVAFTGEIAQNNNASAVSISGNHTGTISFDSIDTSTNVISATNGDGLQFNGADGTYNFNGDVLLDGSSVAADTGIDILSSDGTFTFANTTIIDPTGAAFNVSGGEANVTFTGQISQDNNADTIAVAGGHTGTMTFFDGDGDLITATNGDGLQFNNADGDYAFLGTVSLDGTSNGADTGIDIIGDSDGDFTFSDTTITDPTGIAFNVVGGSSDVTFTGKINQSNNVATVSITGGHNGTMTFSQSSAGGVVNATNGTGLQFDNADGTYSFNSGVVLNGGDAGVDILNDSAGTFNFNSASEITNPTGDAFVITDSGANVNYDGTINNNAGRSVRIENNTSGTVTFDGLVTDTGEGILVNGNTGGSFSFGGGTDLDTTTNDAVTLNNNTGTSISFSSMDINTTTGDGFVATNSEGVTVLGPGNQVTTTGGIGLNLNDVVVGAQGITLDSVSVDGGANGIVMNNVTGGPVIVGFGATSTGDGGIIQNTTGAGVMLTNVEDFTMNFVRVIDSGDDGVVVEHTNATTVASDITINDTVIRGSTTQGVDVDASSTATFDFTMNRNTLDSNGAESVEISINDDASVANVIVNGNVINNTSNQEGLLISTNGAAGKTLNLLVEENTITNNDGTAVAADLQANGAGVVNATYFNNVFVNSNVATGRPFEVSTNDAGADLRLRMEGNDASAGGAGDDYFLIESSGTFRVQNLNNPAGGTIQDTNTGTFDIDPGITEFPGIVPQP